MLIRSMALIELVLQPWTPKTKEPCLSLQDEALSRLECGVAGTAGAAGAAGAGVFGPEAAHPRRGTFPDADSRQVAFSRLLGDPRWS